MADMFRAKIGLYEIAIQDGYVFSSNQSLAEALQGQLETGYFPTQGAADNAMGRELVAKLGDEILELAKEGASPPLPKGSVY